ncbi:unnamed protein product [Calicophoron daubneyi]|uniref:Small ribosomal subunit protein uS10m n=1 Tax=Calicophoron daubneyi TaxID=300641 RepID=A0AAV2T373_CALDB
MTSFVLRTLASVPKIFSPNSVFAARFSTIPTIPKEGDETSESDVLYKKITLVVKGHEPQVLNSYEVFVKEVCQNLALNLTAESRNRPVFTRLCLNKSPFIYKKHQRHYEFRTYYKYFTLDRITGCTADVFLEYVQRNLPEGMAMEVIRHRIEPLPDALQPVSSSVNTRTSENAKN